ncbi:MAG: hypothetical protein EXS25_07385 [Pedosphaera sp.]|nr:hypothetical protein [Pedosphaera sp.]
MVTQQIIGFHLQNICAGGELVRGENTRNHCRLLQRARAPSSGAWIYTDSTSSSWTASASTVVPRFRILAAQQLHEFIVKGFTLDDERLGNPEQPFNCYE